MKKKGTKKPSRSSHQKWFIRVRGSYLPQSSQGWLTYIPYVTYLLGSLIYVIHHNYDLWISVFILIPNWVAAAAIMNWVAANNS